MKETMHTSWIRLFLILIVGVIASANMMAQQGTSINVNGIVKDALGETIIGASVAVKGTTTGTITDVEGRFTLNAPSNSTLVISYIGYKTTEVKAGRELSVVLPEDSELLKEIVVIGYGSVKKEDLTGSITAIKVDELNRGSVTSPQQLIQGKVSGVFVQPGNGQPGAGSTLRIRSGASLNASNDPLIVVDGIPLSNDAAPGMSNGLSAINPNDIETFTVLKDASATAIYGSRASNGVIIITTKKGGKDKIKVSYNSTYSLNDPYKKIKTLKANEYREIVANTISDANREDAMALLNMYPEQSTDWQKEVFRTAFGTDQNLSVAGTTLEMPYRLSFGYNNEDGTLRTSNYERYTLDLSTSRKLLNDHLNITLNVKGTINNNKFANDGAIGAAAFYDPTKPIYNETGAFNGYWNWTKADGEPNNESSANPLQSLFDRYDSGKTKRSMGNVQFDYKFHFLPELRANLNLGYDIARGKGDKGDNQGSYSTEKDDTFKGIGRGEYWNNFRRNQLLEYYMNYEKDFEKIKSRVNVMGGYSWQRFYYANLTKNYSRIVDGFTPKPNDWYKDEEAGEYVKPGSYLKPGENYLISFFGRANYTLMNRYLLTGTIRRDGSSKFAKDNRWGTFTSAAAAWTITNESFMKDFKALSNLKLRVGYGSTGQQDMSDYQYLATYHMGSNQESMYLDDFLLKPGKYNPDLKWESTDTYNIGLDFGFLSNRINGSIEYYKKKTKDLLSDVSVPAGTNFSNRMMQNIGNMENRGVEFNIDAAIIDTKDFAWDAGFNITWNESKITKLIQKGNESYPGIDVGGVAGTGSFIQKHIVGYAPFTYNVYQQVYDESGKPVQNAFVDRDGDGKITEADRYLTHSPMPKYYLGFNSMFRYKQFDLGFNLRANVDNYVFNELAAQNSSTSSAFSGMGFLTNLHESVYRTGFRYTNTGEQAKSDLFLENASFLKMDNLTFGYNFNRLFSEKLSGRLSFSVQNVFTLTDYTGLDPENSGIDNSIWPRPRTYTLGLGLNF